MLTGALHPAARKNAILVGGVSSELLTEELSTADGHGPFFLSSSADCRLLFWRMSADRRPPTNERRGFDLRAVHPAAVPPARPGVERQG